MKASTRQKIRNTILVIIPLLLAGLFVVFVFIATRTQPEVLNHVVINEVCTNNNAIFIDADNDGCDYIEIYNPTNQAVDISGWYLSDNSVVLAKEKLVGKVLEPGDFYIIYLNGNANFAAPYLATGPLRDASSGECVGFSLSSTHKENLYLSDGSLNIVDEITIPVMEEDMCYVRTADGGSVWDVRTPSPFETNSASKKEPEPFPMAVPVTEFSDDRYTVNVTMRNEDLFDYEKGIYTEGVVWDRYLALDDSEKEDTGFVETDKIYYSNWKQGWKRKAYIEIYDNAGNLIEEKFAHVSCHGNTSIVDDSKSLNVYCDDADGFHIFEDTSSQSSFLLRNGGSERFQTKFRDPLLQSRAKGLNVSVQDYIFADVYLNGTYLGPYAVMEKYNCDYFEKHYGVDTETIAVLKNPIGQSRGYAVEGTVSDEADFIALEDFARVNDLTDDANYQYIADRLDIDNFIDYIAVISYLGNVDAYPNNNIFVWRSKNDDGNPYSDGKWRFMLQDLDATAGADISYDSYTPDDGRMRIVIDNTIDNFVTNLVAWDGNGAETNLATDPLFSALMQRDDFRTAFEERITYIADEVYDCDTMNERIDEAYDKIKSGWVESSGVEKSVLKRHRNDFQEFFEGRKANVLYYLGVHFPKE